MQMRQYVLHTVSLGLELRNVTRIIAQLFAQVRVFGLETGHLFHKLLERRHDEGALHEAEKERNKSCLQTNIIFNFYFVNNSY